MTALFSLCLSFFIHYHRRPFSKADPGISPPSLPVGCYFGVVLVPIYSHSPLWVDIESFLNIVVAFCTVGPIEKCAILEVRFVLSSASSLGCHLLYVVVLRMDRRRWARQWISSTTKPSFLISHREILQCEPKSRVLAHCAAIRDHFATRLVI